MTDEGLGSMLPDDFAEESTMTATSLEELARLLGANVQASVVFADPIQRDGITVVPVARAAWGVGRGGSRDGRTPGPNMGGGVTIRPIGYLEIRNERVSFQSITGRGAGPWLAAAVGLAFGLGMLLGRRRAS